MFLLWVKEAEKEIEIPPRAMDSGEWGQGISSTLIVYRPGDLICMDYFGIFSPREFGDLPIFNGEDFP
jgi:hypothetical protein